MHGILRNWRSILVSAVVIGVVGASMVWWWYTSRPDYRLQQARSAVVRGDTKVAERQALLFEAGADRDRAHLLRAHLFVHEKYYAKALQHLNQVRDQGALRLEAAAMTGRCLVELGETYQAERAYRFLLRKDPDHADAHRGLAAVYFDQGALPQAIQHCQEWARLQPTDGKPHRFMGFIYRDLEKYEQAILSFREALARDLSRDVHEEVRLEMAESLIKRGHFQAALDALAQSQPPAEGLAKKLTLSAEAARGLGQSARAKALVDDALRLDRDHVPGLRLAGALFLESKEFDKAVYVLEHAVRRDPHDFTARHRLSQAYVGLGRLDAAREQQTKMKESQTLLSELNRLGQRLMNDPRDAHTHARLAEVFDKLSRPADAARSRRNAQALHGGSVAKTQPAEVLP
jgi:tetratricopeptide (TPR) repeat protein